MFSTFPLATRPLMAAWRLPRPFGVTAPAGEFGWASWSFSRQAKLNAWAWHGLGSSTPLAWAQLGNCLYLRRDEDSAVAIMEPDVFLEAGEVSADSLSVEATTQWLDFGKPGKMKALTGIDFDGKAIEFVEIYVAVGGDREGTLAETIPIGANNGGWTYNGEIIPLGIAATEFKLKFIAHPNLEAQVNRLTLHWDPIEG